jgi:F-box protein 9
MQAKSSGPAAALTCMLEESHCTPAADVNRQHKAQMTMTMTPSRKANKVNKWKHAAADEHEHDTEDVGREADNTDALIITASDNEEEPRSSGGVAMTESHIHTSAPSTFTAAAIQSSLSIKIPENNGTGATWELTWPIWHLLPVAERQRIAADYGMRIGEFEEFVSLQEAVGDSLPSATAAANPSLQATASKSNKDRNNDNVSQNKSEQQEARTMMATQPKEQGFVDDIDSNCKPLGKLKTGSVSWVTDNDDFEEEEEDDNTSSASDPMLGLVSAKSDSKVEQRQKQANLEELVEQGGLMMLLPDELIHRIMSHLDIYMYAQCALVSSTWRSFTRTEAAYRVVCERTYLHQSKRKQLNLTRFKTYRNMLATRPRVRTGGGMYILKYSHVKKIQRDMWTEVPIGAVLETTYYRYLMFDETNGTLLYSLTPKGPLEMIPKFVKFQRQLIGRRAAFDREEEAPTSEDKRILLGEYQVHRDRVRVRAKYAWSYLQMELRLITQASEAWQSTTKFGEMALVRHETSKSGSFHGHDIVDYAVPIEPFLFLTDRRL